MKIRDNDSERSIYNYADDNTVSSCDKTIDGLHNKLTVSGLLLQWFTENYMQANASKLQYIMFRSADKVLDNSAHVLHIDDGVDLKSKDCVKLLGVDVDQSLSFKDHISRICKKAARQLNALSTFCQTF